MNGNHNDSNKLLGTDNSSHFRKSDVSNSTATVPDELRRKVTEQLKKGVAITKLGKWGWPHKKNLCLTEDEKKIFWKSKWPWKSSESTSVDLARVDRLQPGCTTVKMQRFKSKLNPHHCFSIIYNSSKSLDLFVDADTSKVDVHSLMATVQALVTQSMEKGKEASPEKQYALEQWRLSDRNGDGTLSKEEIYALLKRVNCPVNRHHAEKIFNQVDEDHNNVLDFDEFFKLLSILKLRNEVVRIYTCITGTMSLESLLAMIQNKGPLPGVNPSIDEATSELPVIPVELFTKFLVEVQKEETASEETCREFLHSLNQESDGLKIHFEDFVALLTNPATNEVHEPIKACEVYQDMNYPLSFYWIASSHNTYLEGDQLRSASSVNRYVSDLMKGCRCVELDCWDGDDGEPTIYHGHTLTGKILFKDVIQAIDTFAFQRSQYPVILSIENHCSIPFQQKMAQYMKTIFGEKLALPYLRSDGYLPSPLELKNKILVKGKVLKTPSKSADGASSPRGEEEDDDDSDADDEDDMSKTKKGTKKDGKKKEKKEKTAQELSDITFLGGNKFKGFEINGKDPSNFMSSIGEVKSDKLLKKSADTWVRYNSRQMSRIYPAGTRVDSSNYDPVPHWCVGSQIVALNYQTASEPMQVNDGKFRDNGKCGYLLKPEFLNDSKSTFNPADGPFPSEGIKLVVQVLTGSQLPKPFGASKGEIIDPYVCVEIKGVPRDNKKCQTRAIDDNGFNPYWDETFVFDIACPELALLNMAVWDKDAMKSDFIASATLNVSCIRQGFRVVKLFSSEGSDAATFQFCSLFCRFEIRNESSEKFELQI